MFKVPIIRAWKWLFSHLIITAALSYYATVTFSLSGLAKPETILKTTTYGIRHVGTPILGQGVELGIDQGIMIFLCNMTVALLILSIICWARLLNPKDTNASFPQLRRKLQKDRTARHLRLIPYFARIESLQLRLTVFILLCVPFIATVLLGMILGTLLGSVHMLSSSPLIAFAYIVPHGIPEIAALLLACSVPVAIWMLIKPTVDNENPDKAFRRIKRIASSPDLQRNLKMIINLLLIAGLVEAHFTFKIVSFFLYG